VEWAPYSSIVKAFISETGVNRTKHFDRKLKRRGYALLQRLMNNRGSAPFAWRHLVADGETAP